MNGSVGTIKNLWWTSSKRWLAAGQVAAQLSSEWDACLNNDAVLDHRLRPIVHISITSRATSAYDRIINRDHQPTTQVIIINIIINY